MPVIKLTVNLEGHGYDIIEKRGVLSRVNRLANLDRRVLLVTDDGVPGHIVDTLAAQCGRPEVAVLPAGEAAKSPQHALELARRMQAAGFGRDDALLAAGGGAVCDVAGYAAATYMEGVACVLVPTTAVAQLSSSVCGAARLHQGGQADVLGLAFWPELVAADPELLDSLPPRHRTGGLAAALAAALARSAELFDILENEDPAEQYGRILYLATLARRELVMQDPAGKGPAGLLGLGALFGRAFLAAGGFSALTWAEALALGLLPALESRTLARRARAVMKKLGLPVKLPFGAEAVWPHLQRDVARTGDGRYLMARVKTLGEGYLEKVEAEELRLLLEGMS